MKSIYSICNIFIDIRNYIRKKCFEIYVYPNYSAYIFYFQNEPHWCDPQPNLRCTFHCCPPIFIINAFYQKIPTFVYMFSHGITCADWHCRYNNHHTTEYVHYDLENVEPRLILKLVPLTMILLTKHSKQY